MKFEPTSMAMRESSAETVPRYSLATPRPVQHVRRVTFLSLAVIVLGTAFRFTNLNAALFWQDEAVTALRVTGHTKAEYLKIFDGRIRPVAAIAKFESIDASYGVAAVARGLRLEEPQHSPLFYMLDRLWIGYFGTSAVGFRGCSALIGTLGIAIAFALGATLLRSRLAGAVAAALFALSPIFVLYARQAREYALFQDAGMLATLAYVHAIRGGVSGWIAYSLAVAFGMYVDPIFALIIVAHGASAVLDPQARLKRLRAWVIASVIGVFAFAPWALDAVHASKDVSTQLDWGRTAYPLSFLAQKWIFNIAALDFDGEFKTLLLAPIAIVSALATLVAFVVFIFRGERSAVRVIAPLGGVTFLVFEGRDVLLGSHFATIVRYLSPLWLALLFALAAVITRELRSVSRRRQRFALSGFVVVLAMGAASGFMHGNAENWWDNNDQIAFQAMARVINKSKRPLVITQYRPHVPLVIARYLRSDAEFLTFDTQPPTIPRGRNAYLIAPSPEVRKALAEKTHSTFRIENVSPNSTNIITGFHKDLDRSTPAIMRGDALVFVPDNALWALVPLPSCCYPDPVHRQRPLNLRLSSQALI